MNHLKLITKFGHTRFIHASAKIFDSTKTDLKDLKKIEELVPSKPVKSKINLNLLPPKTKIDRETIALLERLSLVDCANKEGIKTLEDAIEFADQILQVDTKGVEPLITVLEDRPLITREDAVTDGNIKEQILSNAVVTEDEYFVAPPGNIPLTTRQDLLHEESIPNINKQEILDINSTENNKRTLAIASTLLDQNIPQKIEERASTLELKQPIKKTIK